MHLDMRNDWEKTMKRLVGPLIALLVLCPAALAQDKSTSTISYLIDPKNCTRSQLATFRSVSRSS
jgi:hypothetical protein